MASLRDLLVSRLGQPKASTAPEIRFDCPFCAERGHTPDTKGRLWVNERIRKFICYRCEIKGGSEYLLGKLGIHEHVMASAEELDTLLAVLSSPVASEELDPESEVEYPCFVEPVEIGTRFFDYIVAPRGTKLWFGGTGRGFDPGVIRHYSMMAGAETPYKNRLFIPVIGKHGQVTYWSARDISGKSAMKYLNPGRERRTQIFNYNGAMNYEDVIIAEGVLSAIGAGVNAVALLGKTHSKIQLQRLVSGGWRRYYVALDPDAFTNAMTLTSDLTAHDCEVWIVRMPLGEDPASLPNFGDYLAAATKFDATTSILEILR